MSGLPDAVLEHRQSVLALLIVEALLDSAQLEFQSLALAFLRQQLVHVLVLGPVGAERHIIRLRGRLQELRPDASVLLLRLLGHANN